MGGRFPTTISPVSDRRYPRRSRTALLASSSAAQTIGRPAAPSRVVTAGAFNLLKKKEAPPATTTKTTGKAAPAKGKAASNKPGPEVYVCRDCGYVYDPSANRGKAFASLPEVRA